MNKKEEEMYFKMLDEIKLTKELVSNLKQGWNEYEKQNVCVSNAPLNTKRSETMKYNGKTITKRKDRKNEWVLRFRQSGLARAVYGKTQKECIAKYKQALKQPKEQPKTKYTLKQWFEKFLELYKIGKVRDTTIKKDYEVFNYLKKFENKKLEEITAFQMQEFIYTIKAPTVRKNIYILINCLLEKATNLDIVQKNVMKSVDKPKYKAKEKTALTKKQEEKFIQNCKKDKNGIFFLVMLYQGLRRGECWALRVNDVNLEENTLRIDESKNVNSSSLQTKNEQSNRIIPFFGETKKLLKPLLINKKPNDFIFDIKNTKISESLKGITKDLNIKITPHILRHTFITRCQENNVPLYVIQSWVGHERGSVVTTKVYTHLNEETVVRYTTLMNEIYKKQELNTKVDTQTDTHF